MSVSTTLRRIQSRSQQLSKFLTLLLFGLLALMLLERFGSVALQFGKEGPTEDGIKRFVHQLVKAIPECFFLLALAGIRQTLCSLGKGELFAPTIVRMLGRIGIALAVGAFINVFLVPTAGWMLGFGPGYLIAYDVSGLTLGALGLSLSVIANLLQRASELQSELEEIF